MDLAIVQRLVCPTPHAITPLVVRADATAHGRMVAGVLGCPVCDAEWRVVDGIAQFGSRATLATTAPADAITIAALLGLADPEVIVVDGAVQGSHELSGTYGAVVIAMDAEQPAPSETNVIGAGIVPLAAGVARGVALLRADRTVDFIASAVRALATQGRMVAASALPVPSGVHEIARNELLWVAEREPDVVPVPLRRRT